MSRQRPRFAVLAVLTVAVLLGAAPPARADDGLTVVAGTGAASFSGDGGPAAQATLDAPDGVAVAPDGTVYVSDGGNGRVRAVSPTGVITTVAGSGGTPTADVPDGARGTEVALGRPGGLAVAADRTVYIGDLGNHRVRSVSPDGVITTVAGDGAAQLTVAGGPATEVAVPAPNSLAVGSDGAVWIVDGFALRRLRAGTLATVTLQPAGGSPVVGGAGDTRPWEVSTEANWPPKGQWLNTVLAVTAAGDRVYVIDSQLRAVLRLRDGPAGRVLDTAAEFTPSIHGPVAVSAAGIAYLADGVSRRVYSVHLRSPAAAGGDSGEGDGAASTSWWLVAAAVAGAAAVVAALGWLVRRRLA